MTTGLVGSFRKILDNSIAALQHRVRLVSLELREEKSRFVEVLLLTLGAFFLGLMAIIILTATIVLLFDERYRIYAVGFFFLLYAGGAFWAFQTLRSRLGRYPLAFSTTAEELEKDREWIRTLK